ncbi:hypothetical protein Pmani_011955 [Petrolisthes manimaculis]|uniref:Uncharacterized protein n=1 Tax=Petrolisthes manimaculis TaxID=1843537 RepID=A0AAE1PZ08_9EUCA|nr:hypothetical protein Pmani_011955 [Petrolisthes manimaculis]
MTTGAPRTAAHHSLISFVFLDALSFRPTQRVGPDPTRRPSARQGSVRPPHTQQQACCLVSSNSLNLSTLDLAECPDKNGLMQGCNVENKLPMWFGNETQGRHSGESRSCSAQFFAEKESVDIESSFILSLDSVPVSVEAVIYMRVRDATAAETNVEDYRCPSASYESSDCGV